MRKKKNWNWDSNFKEQIGAELLWNDDDSEEEIDGEFDVESEDDENNEEGNNAGTVTQIRERRMPSWMDDYLSGGLSEEEVEAYIHGARHH